MKGHRLLLLSLIVVALLVGGCGLWVWRAKRQYALNRQLIVTLVNGDTKQALALVNAGADPNTRYNLPASPSWQLLIAQVLHRSPGGQEINPTAFMIACGAIWQSEPEVFYGQKERSETPYLVEAMFAHSANLNAQEYDLSTALTDAVTMERPSTVAFLLAHGANADACAAGGWSPLMRAVEYNHNLNIIRMLLAHGADPQRRSQAGFTAISLAQEQKRPDMVALMRKGAK